MPVEIQQVEINPHTGAPAATAPAPPPPAPAADLAAEIDRAVALLRARDLRLHAD